MTRNTLRIGDTVIVTAGIHSKKQGTIETRRGTCWVVVFPDKSNAQLMASALKRITT